MSTPQSGAALVAKGPVTVALTKLHDPDAFYRTRAGLHVFDCFSVRIVRRAKPIVLAQPVTLRHFVLERDTSDKDIEAELGPSHVFTESEVCWIVAEMIAKQEGGTAGDLDNSGKANLFYTPSWVVDVFWNADGRWSVFTWPLDNEWDAGDSAFSRN